MVKQYLQSWLFGASALAFVLIGSLAEAQDWGGIATISSTMGVNASRICLGEASRGDIGCPLYAPQILANGTISTSGLTVNGVAITGSGGGGGDTISSNTTSVVAQTGGVISITTNGSTANYFDTGGRLITAGVSVTGYGISASTGYFPYRVGIGISTPFAPLDVSAASVIFRSNNQGNGPLLSMVNSSGATAGTFGPGLIVSNNVAGVHGYIITQMQSAGSPLAISRESTPFTNYLAIDQSGNVGISTAVPNAKLDVYGTISSTNGYYSGNVGIGVPPMAAGLSNLFVDGGTLGSTAGNIVSITTFRGLSSNADQLNFTLQRMSAGSDWTTSALRLQRTVDLSNMGYIQFGNFAPGSDMIVFGRNNSENMRLDGDGDLGIGTINPTAKLQVSGTVRVESAGGSAIIEISRTAGSFGYLQYGTSGSRRWHVGIDSGAEAGSMAGSNFYINRANDAGTFIDTPFSIQRSTGRIGISTTNPTAELTVNGTVAATNFTGNGSGLTNLPAAATDRLTSGTVSLITYSTGAYEYNSTGNVVINTNGSATGDNNLQLGNGRSGNGYSFIDIITDATYTDYGLRIIRNNTGPNAASWIQTHGTGGLYLFNGESAPIMFFTTSAERVRINDNGLGIGNTNPTSALVVSGSATLGGPSSGVGYVAVTQGTPTNTGYTDFMNAAGGSIGYIGWGTTGSGINVLGRSGNGLVLGASNTGVVTITNGLNVGINNAAPATKLAVNGEVQVSSTGIACSVSTQGSFRYTGGKMQACVDY